MNKGQKPIIRRDTHQINWKLRLNRFLNKGRNTRRGRSRTKHNGKTVLV